MPPARQLITTRGSLSIEAADGPRGRRVTLVRVVRGDDRGACLERVVEALSRISSPHVPRVLEVHGGPEPAAVLDVPAVMHLGAVLERTTPHSVPYHAGSALTKTLAEALSAAHRAPGGPVVVGALHASNLLVTADGRLALLGFGEQRADWHRDAVMAPAVAVGGACTPSTDVYAGLLFVRSLVRWVAGLPEPLVGLLEGRRDSAASGFARSMATSLLGRGVDAAWSLRWLERFWTIVGKPHPDELARLLNRVASDDSVVVRIADSGATIRIDAQPPIDLSRRRALRAIAWALATARLEGRGELHAVDLVAAGWPGESLIGDSGLDRLYVAISSLRALGLPVERGESGYALARGAVVVADDA